MSRASAAVRFPDGRIRYGLYCGTSDVMYSGLYDDPHAPWDDYYPKDGSPRHYERLHPDAQEGEIEFDVVIYIDYGNGFYWKGTATQDRILTGLCPYDEDIEETNGSPDWLTWEPA